MTKKKMTFEEALSGLEKSVEMLKNQDTALEAAIKSFEEGVACYDHCSEILKETKQKIEVYDRKSETTEEF